MKHFFLYAIFLAGLWPPGGHMLWGQKDTLSIGLLLPDSSSRHIASAAQELIQETNLATTNRYIYKLVVRSTEGPWGMGSKQSVSLVYDDEVMAMVGWLDGRNAHLAEQVAAKSHLIYLETRATDPTLSQAYVPWFFRMVPSDDQQARILLELIKKEGGGRLAILTREDYDTRYAVQSLIQEAAIHVGNAPLLLPVPPEESDQKEILDQLQNEKIKHLIVPVLYPAVYELLLRVSTEIPALQMYGTLAFTRGLENSSLDPGSLPGLKLIHTYTEGELVPGSSLSSSYVRDALLVLIAAIEEARGDRELLKTFLSDLTGFRGITGPVSFDEMGNRTGDLQILKLP